MNTPTPEQIAQHYKAVGDSVWLINAIITGTEMDQSPEQERRDAVDRNVRHLEIMVAKDFWTDEDMTGVVAAILAGRSYLA
jgi:hypothetical protein